MLTVTFAFVLATALFFLFRQTRALGVVGVFILFCISPLVFGSLLLMLGLLYYFLFVQKRQEFLPRDPRPLTDNSPRRSRGRPLLVVAVGVGGALLLSSLPLTSEDVSSKILGGVRSVASDDVIVLRTPGGLMEVSRIQATESIDARYIHEVLGIEVGHLVPRIRVPAVYRYHIELEPEWRVVRSDGVFTVVVPKVKPSLPVAVDFAGIEREVAGTFILLPFKSSADLATLEKSVSVRLAQKASSRDYLDKQRTYARETVKEFVRKWLVEQTRYKDASGDDIRVMFADESVASGLLSGEALLDPPT